MEVICKNQENSKFGSAEVAKTDLTILGVAEKDWVANKEIYTKWVLDHLMRSV